MENIGYFVLENQDHRARAGRLRTLHGEILTPVFMVVGTRASVRTLLPDDLEHMQAQVLLANTYHLHLRPSSELIQRRGGIHEFMNWHKPVLTDSGGFQVFSLAHRNKVTEEGLYFQSHIDGSSHLLTPEKSIQIQKNLNADIIMAFDECLAYPSSRKKVQESIELTRKWLKRCQKEHLKNPRKQLLFGIVQGGLYSDLRQESLKMTLEMDLPGYALGGLSVGEPREKMLSLLSELTSFMPLSKPRYLMGVGKPLDLIHSIDQGIDMFDCIIPTRTARNGTLYTWQGQINIKRKEFKEDDSPLDKECSCYTCRHFSKAYLRYLFSSGEWNAARLNTLHNVHFYLDLMKKARKAILENRWEVFKKECLSRFKKEDNI